MHLKDGWTTYKGVILVRVRANEMRKLERNMRRANDLGTYLMNERELIEQWGQSYPAIVQAIIDQFCENDDGCAQAKPENGAAPMVTDEPKAKGIR